MSNPQEGTRSSHVRLVRCVSLSFAFRSLSLAMDMRFAFLSNARGSLHLSPFGDLAPASDFLRAVQGLGPAPRTPGLFAVSAQMLSDGAGFWSDVNGLTQISPSVLSSSTARSLTMTGALERRGNVVFRAAKRASSLLRRRTTKTG